MVLVSGLDRELTPKEIGEFQTVSIEAFGAVYREQAEAGIASYGLSKLQVQTLQMLANGASIERIGLVMKKSPLTVQTLLSATREALGAKNQLAMIATAMREGIIS